MSLLIGMPGVLELYGSIWGVSREIISLAGSLRHQNLEADVDSDLGQKHVKLPEAMKTQAR